MSERRVESEVTGSPRLLTRQVTLLPLSLLRMGKVCCNPLKKHKIIAELFTQTFPENFSESYLFFCSNKIPFLHNSRESISSILFVVQD